MRRVYYSYAVDIFTHVVFWQGVFLSVSALLLAKWLHVASIVKNVLAVPVGHVPQYVANSFFAAATQGEVVTVVMFMLAGVVTMSCGYKLTQALAPKAIVMYQV